MEFGCGTGLLSFELKDFFKRITLIDTSEGMINILRDKIQKFKIQNFSALNDNLLENEVHLSKQDVIYTLMTLHHIGDINKLLKIFSSCLENEGYLCIADLVKEDGSFHEHKSTEFHHNGFDRNKLTAILEMNLFEVIYYEECFIIEKHVDEGIKKYPLFLMISKKKGQF